MTVDNFDAARESPAPEQLEGDIARVALEVAAVIRNGARCRCDGVRGRRSSPSNDQGGCLEAALPAAPATAQKEKQDSER